MRTLLPVAVAILGFAALFGGVTLAVRGLYPDAWKRGLRRAVWLLPGFFVLFFGGGIAARVLFGLRGAAHYGIGAAGGIVVLLACLLVPAQLGLALRRLVERLLPAKREPPASSAGELEAAGVTTRRELLIRTAQVLPATGVAAAAAGTVGGFGGAQLTRLEMTFPDLPADLEGFSILHYTDLHLGTFVDLVEVERLVELGRTAKADLVVLTGDMSDDLGRLLPALRRFESLDPPYGVVASIGNHEYFRGLKESLSAYARTRVEMLLETGVSVPVKSSTLFIGGADDPRILRGDKMAFMERTVNETLDGAPSDAFRLLLSHRPEGFVPAAKAGFDLTLSGHTHGGQVGFNGRSVLEGFLPDRYLWGAYSAGDRRLYTSAGAGHWFPFRLGCPREVPLVVLKRGPAGPLASRGAGLFSSAGARPA